MPTKKAMKEDSQVSSSALSRAERQARRQSNNPSPKVKIAPVHLTETKSYLKPKSENQEDLSESVHSSERLQDSIAQSIKKFNKISGHSKGESGSLHTKLKESIKAELASSFKIEQVSIDNPTVTDVFLSITDIGLGCQKFDTELKPKKRDFWQLVKTIEPYDQLFLLFKASNLHRIWGSIVALDNLKSIVPLICSNKGLIDKRCPSIEVLLRVLPKITRTSEEALLELINTEKNVESSEPIRQVTEEKRIKKVKDSLYTFTARNAQGPLDTKFDRKETQMEDKFFKAEMERIDAYSKGTLLSRFCGEKQCD